jgi:hypothetical protein
MLLQLMITMDFKPHPRYYSNNYFSEIIQTNTATFRSGFLFLTWKFI